MSEELQKQLIAMLQGLTEAAKSGASWAAGQIPPLISEKILIGRIENTFFTILALVIVVGIIWWALTKLPKQLTENANIQWPDNNDALIIVECALAIIFGLVFIVVFFAGIHDMLLVWFAPRLYIVEWLMNLK